MSAAEAAIDEAGSGLVPPRPGPVTPFEAAELRAVFGRPHRIVDIVLTDYGRLIQTIEQKRNLGLLAAVLFYATVLFSVPYAAVLAWDGFWRIPVMLLGSLAICLPSLQVFCAYVGFRIGIGQNTALGLVIACVAALFTFGFFPILWFLEATMLDDSTVTPGHLSVVLLVFSLVAGCLHFHRLLGRMRGVAPGYLLLTVFWQILFLFITHRMAQLLGVW